MHVPFLLDIPRNCIKWSSLVPRPFITSCVGKSIVSRYEAIRNSMCYLNTSSLINFYLTKLEFLEKNSAFNRVDFLKNCSVTVAVVTLNSTKDTVGLQLYWRKDYITFAFKGNCQIVSEFNFCRMSLNSSL